MKPAPPAPDLSIPRAEVDRLETRLKYLQQEGARLQEALKENYLERNEISDKTLLFAKRQLDLAQTCAARRALPQVRVIKAAVGPPESVRPLAGMGPKQVRLFNSYSDSDLMTYYTLATGKSVSGIDGEIHPDDLALLQAGKRPPAAE